MKKLEKIVRYNYNKYDGDERQFTFKPWEKNGKSRIYMSDYKSRTIGYIDRADGHFELMDKQGLSEEEIEAALEQLKAEYETVNA